MTLGYQRRNPTNNKNSFYGIKILRCIKGNAGVGEGVKVAQSMSKRFYFYVTGVSLRGEPLDHRR